MEAIEGAVGGDIVIDTQPANSPDLSVNDLGFFHSIQQLKEYVWVTNTQKLVEATAEAFDAYPRDTLECVWKASSQYTAKCWGPRVTTSTKFPTLARKRIRRRASSLRMPRWMQQNTVL
ncbi:unnamed protein product, partial [Discosporangium mesarthrocarpum]